MQAAPPRELTILLPPGTSPESVSVTDRLAYVHDETIIAADSERLVVTELSFDEGETDDANCLSREPS